MRKAIFKRVGNGPIKLKNADGVTVILKPGDRAVCYYEIVNGMPDMVFESFGESLNSVDVTIKKEDNVYTIVDVPSKESIKNFKPSFTPLDTSEPPDNPNADKDCKKCNGIGKYSFGGSYGGPVHWSVCECVMFKPEPPPKPTITKGFEPETLKALKAKTPKDWMLVKKHELKKIMDDAGIDYSQVEDDRMSLYKFLFSIIKDLV